MVQFITRAGWGARPPKAVTTRPLNEIVGMCWHHSGGYLNPGSSVATEESAVRGIQGWCMDHNGYNDIDYECVIGPSGNIYVGRSVTVVEAAQSGTWAGRAANESLLGVCFLGDFEPGRNTLTWQAKDAALALVWVTAIGLGYAGGRLTDHFSHHAFAKYHSPGFSTVCPGGGGMTRPSQGDIEKFLITAFHATTE